jgi:hypothetical protein
MSKDKNVATNGLALNNLVIMFLLRLFEMAVNICDYAILRCFFFVSFARRYDAFRRDVREPQWARHVWERAHASECLLNVSANNATLMRTTNGPIHDEAKMLSEPFCSHDFSSAVVCRLVRAFAA